MEEANNSKKLQGHYSSGHYNENDKQKLERLIRIEAETIDRLTNDLEIKAYLACFEDQNVKDFVENYATQKADFIERGPDCESEYELRYNDFSELAINGLKEIQLKKLFDKYFEWGAGLVEIKEVCVTQEFEMWAVNILNCPFLPPISADEISLYGKYLESPGCNLQKEGDFGDLLAIIDDIKEGSYDLPAWFSFHNLYTGAGKYMLLPNYKESKESLYNSLVNDRDKKELTEASLAKETTNDTMDEKPLIYAESYRRILAFIEKFEDNKTLRHFHNYFKMNKQKFWDLEKEDGKETELKDKIEAVLKKLEPFGDLKLPIEAHSDWRIALINAWHKWERERVKECLPAAYDHYCFRIQTKIPFQKSESLFERSDIIKLFKNRILEGRKLNGEPENFDY